MKVFPGEEPYVLLDILLPLLIEPLKKFRSLCHVDLQVELIVDHLVTKTFEEAT